MEKFDANVPSHISVKIGLLIVALHYWLVQGWGANEVNAFFCQIAVSALLFLAVFWEKSPGVGKFRWTVYYAVHVASTSAAPYLLRPLGHDVFNRIITP